jgi:hypothetical protein
MSFHYVSLELGNVEKKQSSDLSKGDNDKQDVTVHPKPMGVVSGKDTHAMKISDPPVPSQCVKTDSSNNVEDEDLFVSVKNGNRMPNGSAEVVPTISTATTCESDLRDVARASTCEDSAPKVVCFQQKLLESAGDDSCNIVEVAQASGDILNETPHGVQMAHNLYPPDHKFDKPDLKREAFGDQSSALENPLGDLVIPELSYIWQYDLFSSPFTPLNQLIILKSLRVHFFYFRGSFEVSRHGNSPEMFDGFQAYLSTCASSKAREVGEQLPDKIQLAEVPRHSSWPLQFKEVNPTEDSIALFFFAKDVERYLFLNISLIYLIQPSVYWLRSLIPLNSYEMAYGKLLENMLLGDLSLTANISGTELLIFPSDKLPERIQRKFLFANVIVSRQDCSLPHLTVPSDILQVGMARFSFGAFFMPGKQVAHQNFL